MFNNRIYHKIDALSGSVATLRAEGVTRSIQASVLSIASGSNAPMIAVGAPESRPDSFWASSATATCAVGSISSFYSPQLPAQLGAARSTRRGTIAACGFNITHLLQCRS